MLFKLLPMHPMPNSSDLGLFCLSLLAFLVGLARILLWAMNTTCFPENFFSSSLTWGGWGEARVKGRVTRAR